jgi:hypothetical protein
LIKKLPQGRVQRTRLGACCRSKYARQIAQRQKKPWLLACSPGLAPLSPATIAILYVQRMTIEQSFRDTKNPQLGQGLSVFRSRSAQRFEMLLLIGHLAAWLLRLIGESAQQEQADDLAVSKHLSYHAQRDFYHDPVAHRAIHSGLQWLTLSTLRACS